MPRQNWSREQDLAVLYGNLTHGRGFDRHPDIARLAAAMGRSVNSVTMRKRNFDSLDPAIPGAGLKNFAQLTREIWDEYVAEPERVIAVAKRAYENILRYFDGIRSQIKFGHIGAGNSQSGSQNRIAGRDINR